MRVIFLDFDGVLNSTDYFEGMHTDLGPAWQDGEDKVLDGVAIERLNRIVERTGAKVVVSSAWRLGRTARRLQRLLAGRGFEGEVIGVTERIWLDTPDRSERERGEEIAEWLGRHPAVELFVILDDDSDMGHLRHRLVRTSHDHGLLDEHVEQAVAMLGEETAQQMADEAAKAARGGR